jgi:hypothetical protein
MVKLIAGSRKMYAIAYMLTLHFPSKRVFLVVQSNIRYYYVGWKEGSYAG